jgi:transaldolase
MSTATSTEHPTASLARAGVSIWLDDLSRDRIASGGLQRLIDSRNVVGITTNPTIFARAIGQGEAYRERIGELKRSGASVDEVIHRLTTDDVRDAADVLRPIHDRTVGRDGWVSIEVSASSAHDAAATLDEAVRLRETIDRPNVLIKIPATRAGVTAMRWAIAAGISVNATLIFSLTRYSAVIDAYLSGLEDAAAAQRELGGIRSVASFFVSRVDALVDSRLRSIDSQEARALEGRAGIANARLAYEMFENAFASDRAHRLAALGAHVQRPLWASTGVKDPRLPDTAYVEELVAPNVVNTMPELTLEAVADHGVIRGNTIAGTFDASRSVLEGLTAVGVSYDDVTAELERNGVAQFAASGAELVRTVEQAVA